MRLGNTTTKQEKTVNCECGEAVILKLVGGQYQNSYIGDCACGRKWTLEDLSENLESDDFEPHAS